MKAKSSPGRNRPSRSAHAGRGKQQRRKRVRALRLEALEDRRLLDGSNTADSLPGEFVRVGTATFFVADDGTHGRELWRTDGTPAGTTLVQDIRPGAEGSIGAAGWLTEVAGDLYFAADDGSHGLELWKHTTASGVTAMVEDIQPGSLGAAPEQLISVGGRVYFTADDGTLGREFWTSDGTLAGTQLREDVYVGSPNSDPAELTAVGTDLYFVALDAAAGAELRKTDTTTGTTTLVRDIQPGPGTWLNAPEQLTAVGSSLFFVAKDAGRGTELWKSDGTEAGTDVVLDIRAGATGSHPTELTAVGGSLFLTVDDGVVGRELWISNGQAAGTQIVRDIRPEGSSSFPANLTAVGTQLYFAADDGSQGVELWTSDGTHGGTRLVKDIFAGTQSAVPQELTAVSSTLFFTAADPQHGRELWRSDGSEADTTLVEDIYPGVQAAAPSGLADIGGTLYLQADDGTHGRELWTSDGTEAGTQILVDINPTLAVTAVFTTDKNNYETGELVDLQVVIEENGQPVPGASVIATVTPPTGVTATIAPVTLYDDGTHGDGAARDGVYGNVFRRLCWTGTYGIDVASNGFTQRGESFTRAGTKSVAVVAGADSDADGLPDNFEVREGTNVSEDDTAVDLDGDTITNVAEYYAGTRPALADTDQDGFADDVEPKQSTDPLTPDDLPAVLASEPAKGSPMVNPAANVKVFFDRAMSTATLSDSTIIVTGDILGRRTGTVGFDAANLQATFDPAVDFLHNERVTVTVTTGVQSTAGRRAAVDYRFAFTVGVPQETPGEFAPRVLAASPPHGAPRVALNAPITVWFDSDIDILTLTDTNIQVTGSVSGPLGASITYNAAERSATVRAFEDFAYGEAVTVTITAGVYGRNQLPLAVDGNTTWTFRTLAAPVADISVPAPHVLATTPAHGGPRVSPQAAIEVVFDVPVNSVLLVEPNVTIVGSLSGNHAYSTVYNNDTRTATFMPLDDFTHSEDVTVTVTTGVQGQDGQALAEQHQFLFHVIAAAPAEVDTPEVLATSPVHGGPMVATGATIDVWFNTPMNSATMNAGTISVVGSVSQSHAANFTYDAAAMRLTITPQTAFAFEEDVTVTIGAAVTDDDGDPSGADYAFTFRTVRQTVTPTTIAGGTISANTTWTAAASPYILTGDVTVAAGVTLTIEAGAVVKFRAVDTPSDASNYDYRDTYWYRYDLIVNGVLNLESTADQKVVLTSSRDDLYGGDSDGSSGSLIPGNWGSIKYNNPNNTLDHAIVRYGGLGGERGYYRTKYDEQMIWAAGSSAGAFTIEDSVMEYAWNRSIYTESAQTPQIRGNTIRAPSGTSATVTVSGSGTIENNRVVNAYNAISSQGANGVICGNVVSGSTYALSVYGGTVTDNQLRNSTYALYQGYRADSIYSGNAFTNITHHVIRTSGALESDFVWDDIQGMGWPYLIAGDVTVNAGATLTIPAGMVVKFQAVDTPSDASNYDYRDTYWYRYDLIVNGVLNLEGTADQNVVFTSSRDDLYGGDSDGASGSLLPGNWGAIKYNNPNNTLDHAIVRYGGLGGERGYYRTKYDEQMVWAAGSAAGVLLIEDSVFERAWNWSIYTESSQTPIVRGNTILSPSGTSTTLNVAGSGTIENNHVVNAYGAISSQGANSVIRGNIVSGSTYALNVYGGTVTDNQLRNSTYALYQGYKADPVYSGNTFTNITHHVIRTSGALESDFVWDDIQGMGWPYLIVGDVTVNGGATLTIPAGMVVKFQAVDTPSDASNYDYRDTYWYRYDLIVNGVLNLEGTADQNVVFTSSRDDLYGGDSDGASGSLIPGNWGSIKYNNPYNTLDHAIVRYGGLGGERGYYRTKYDEQMVWAAGSSAGVLLIEDSVFERAWNWSIYTESNQTPIVRGNTILSPSGTSTTLNVAGSGTIENNHVVNAYGAISSQGANSVIRGNIVSGSTYALNVYGGTVSDNQVRNSTYALYQGYKADPVYSGNTFTNITHHVIRTSGALESDFVWDDIQGMGWPYLIVGDVTVKGGSTLTIPAGIVVKFQAVDPPSWADDYNSRDSYWYMYDLIVDGTLQLQSTGDERIVFTSSRDDLYGGDSDGNSGTLRAGNWGSLKFTNPANSLHDSIVRYGGLGYERAYYRTKHDQQMVWTAAPIEVLDSVLEYASQRGVYVPSGQTAWIHDNIIRHAGEDAVYLDGPAKVEDNVLFASQNGVDSFNRNATIDGNTVVLGTGSGIALRQGGSLNDNIIRLHSAPVYQSGGSASYSDNVLADNTNQVIMVEGTFNDAHWPDVQDLRLPYWVNSSVTVATGKTLSIAGDVIVKFPAGAYLSVDGKLDTLGDAAHPVVFTSYRDDSRGGDSNGNGASTGVAGDWGSIRLNSSDTTLDHVIVQYAGASGNDGAVWVRNNSSPRIEYASISRSAARGVDADSGSNALVRFSDIFSNTSTGIGAWSGQIRDNRIFANAGGGIRVEAGTSGTTVLSNNLVYDNGNASYYGVRLEGGAQAGLVNNTIVQSLGNALELRNTAKNVSLRNNILLADNGYGIYVANDSQTGFTSDYNLLAPGSGAGAVLGYWNANQATLSAWRSATGQDSHSGRADPLFLDRDGADNTLATADDNYHLRAGSPAIDSANAVGAPLTDRDGRERFDDPGTPNVGGGTPDYVDMGAYEFHSDSGDVVPPTVTDIPTLPPPGTDSTGGFAAIIVNLSESLDEIAAGSMGNYRLRDDGPDDTFDTADDAIYPLIPQYTGGESSVRLVIATGVLPPERFRLTLSSGLRDPAGNPLDGDGDGTGGDDYVRLFTITTELAVSVEDASLVEGHADQAMMQFTVRLSGPTTFPVTVDYASADGTATAPGDYQATSGSLTFNPEDALEKTVQVPVFGDTAAEPSETLYLDITRVDGAVVGDGRGVGTIVDDDSPGEIHGRVFQDLDEDGQWDGTEPGLAGRTVTLDDDGDGLWDVQTTTNAQGLYEFLALPIGNYTVGSLVPEGWLAGSPPGNVYAVTIEPGESETGLDFGWRLVPDLMGISVAYTDVAGNPITALSAGQEFRIVVSAQDLRTTGADMGVFSAFADVLYNTALIDVTAITHLAPFQVYVSGSVDDANGLMNEVGGVGDVNPPVNRSPQPLFRLDAVVIGEGSLTVSTRAADLATSENILWGADYDLRERTAYGSAQIPIYGDPDLRSGSLDADPDHVLTGKTTVSFTVVNAGSGPAGSFDVNIVLSDDAVIGNADDLVVKTVAVSGLAGGATSSVFSVPVQLPVPTLHARALADDPVGLGTGHVSTSFEYVGIVIDPANAVVESDETNNANLPSGKDDVTYFPWDIDRNGQVTPTDAVFVLNRLAQTVPPADARADLDGNGVVTPAEPMRVLNRLGYLINDAVKSAPKGGSGSDAVKDGGGSFSGSGGNGPKAGGATTVQVALELVDLDGQPGVLLGEAFDIAVHFTDVRDAENPQGVFSGYGDLHFDPARIQVNGISYSALFPFGRAGTWNNTTGLVNEAGATDGVSVHTETLVFTVHCTALNYGETAISSSAGEELLSEIVVYGDDLDQRANTEFGALTLLIVGDTVSPTVSSFAPVGLVGQPVDRLELVFSEPIAPGTFDTADVLVTGPGGEVPAGALTVQAVPAGQSRTYQVLIAPALAAEGVYEVRLGPGIQDFAGWPMPAAYQARFTIDTTGSQILGMSPSGTVNQPVPYIDLTFSEAVQGASFTSADVTLRDPGGNPVAISEIESLGQNVYRVRFAPQSANGSYTLTVGPEILDLAGNQMDQNRNGATGEVPGDRFTGSFTIALPDLWLDPAASDALVLPATASFGEAIEVRWTVGNAGTAPAAGNWADRLYLSPDAVWDSGDIALGSQSFGGPVSPGAEYAGVLSVTLPLSQSLTDGTYFVLVRADDAGTVVEADEANNVLGRAISLTRPSLPDLTVSAISTTAVSPVIPCTPIEVSWQVANGGSVAAQATWTEQVFLSPDGAIGGDIPIAQFTYSDSIAAGGSIPRTEWVTIPAWGVAGDLRLVVVVDSNETVVEQNEANNAGISAAAVTVPLTLTMILPRSEVTEDEPNPVMRGVVTRSGPLDAPLTVTLSSSQTDELTVPAAVLIQAGQPSAAFFVQVQPDGTADGDQSVALGVAAEGHLAASQSVLVLDADQPTLTLSFDDAQLTEGESATGTVRRDAATGSPLVVSLSASRSGDLDFPPTVTIPGGAATVTFTLLAVDDQVPEVTETATLTASAARAHNGTAGVTIVDNDEPTLSLVFSAAEVVESAGAMALTGTVRRAEATGVALTVQLTSSDMTEAAVPAEVVIAAGAASVDFFLAAVDDTIVDGAQAVTIQAVGIIPSCGCGMPAGGTGVANAALQVLDDDGPTLSVVVDRALLPEGQASATTGRVFRNTGTSGPLTVALQSSDLSELSVPANVVIPDGADWSAPFLVTTHEDGEADGPQAVTITASAAGFASGTVPVIVTDIDVPDLVVTDLSGPATAFSEKYGNLSYTVSNLGLAEAIAGNADPANGFPGSWQDRVFLSADAVIGDDILVGTYTFAGTLPTDPALNHYSRTVPFRAPLKAGNYWVVVTTDLGQTVAEGIETNNTAISRQPIHVTAAYTATVQTDVELAVAGTPVLMYGQATDSATGVPAPFVMVNIHITVRGTERVISAITDENGHFSTTFRPLPGEGGRYGISATHPGVEAPGEPQDTFVLQGLGADPGRPQGTVAEGGTARFEFDLSNLSDVPLTGLSMAVQSKPDNLSVTLPAALPAGLLGLESIAVAVDIAAVDSSVPQDTVKLRFTTAEGATLDVPIDVTVNALRARLVPDPARVLAASLRAQQTVVEFRVTNTGAAASGPIAVRLPELDWLSLSTPTVMASLEPGASGAVVLMLAPPADAMLTAYEGTIVLATGQGDFEVPFTFRVVSESTGHLEVTAADEFYFYTAEAPKLGGAAVIVRDAVTRAELFSATTGESGEVTFPDLREGYYTVEVSAPDHDGYTETLFLAADQTNHVLAYLRRQTVKHSWSVERIEIEDRYVVHVDTVFETNVPAPVVTVDPPLIDMSDLLVVGQRMQVDLTLTNHGLISANNTELYFGKHPEIRITPLIQFIGELPAKSSLMVPVLIERVLPPKLGPAGAAKGSDICHIPAHVVYSWVCIKDQWVLVPVHTVPPRDFACPPATPRAGGGGGGSGGSGGSGGRVTSIPVTASDQTCKSKPDNGCKIACYTAGGEYTGGIINALKSALRKIPGLKELDLGLSATGQICLCCSLDLSAKVEGSLKGKVGVEIPLSGVSIKATVDAPGSIHKVVYELTASALQVTGKLEAGGRGTLQKECDGAVKLCGSVFASGTIGLEARFKVGATLVEKFTGTVVAGSVFDAYGGVYGSVEFAYNFCDEQPNCWTLKGSADLKAGVKFAFPAFGVNFSHEISVNLWNDSTGNCPKNPPADAGPGLKGDPYDQEVIVVRGDWWGSGPGPVVATEDDLWETFPPESFASVLGFANPSQLEDRLGWTFPEGPLSAADVVSLEDRFRAAYPLPDEGICATVALQLSQDAVLTREAFAAELQIENGLPIPLEDIEIQIGIHDLSGNDAEGLFAIRPPSLQELTATDGTGQLAAATTGSANWLIVPTPEAAREAPTEYIVSGTLRYRENDTTLTFPLQGVRITVHPQAELDLQYFHQRDVFSDDPWTDEIEPAQPYQLAVMVENRGAGAANDLRIESAQPRIVENEKGLLIDFKILGTEVAGQNLTPSLTADFGDLTPGEIKIARWWLTSTLQGQFIDYEATFEHVDGLGDERLSLIKNVSIHELIHAVRADRQFEDGLPDFLVNDLIDPDDLPDTLYLSDGSEAIVMLATNALADGPVTPQDLTVQLTTDMPGGWGYLRMQGTDPGGSDYRLVQVLRSDGSQLPVQNFWQTDRTFIELGRRPRLENNLHLFDHTAAAGPQTYTLIYEKRDQVGPAISSLEMPDSPRSAAVASLEAVFSEPLAAHSFDWHDLTLLRDGSPVTLDGRVTVAQVSGGTYRIDSLADFTGTDGLYELTVDAAGVTDRSDNAGHGSRTVSWAKAAAVPYVVAIHDVEAAWRNTPVETVEVEFSQPINAGTLSAADLILTLNGGANLIDPQTSALTFVQTGETTYRIGSLAGVSLAEGNYQLTVSAAGVTDLAGNTGVGQRSVAWIMDTTPPTVVSLSGVGAATNQAVAALTLTFSERLNAASLNSASLSLRRDGGPNLLGDPLQVAYLQDGAYSLTGLSALTGLDGDYVLSVSAARVRDLAGNAGTGSGSLAWTRDSIAPTPAANLTITPDTGVSNTDRRTNSLSVVAAGELAEPGLTVGLFDLTTGTDLGPATVTGLTFAGSVQFTSGGLHELRVRVTDAAGNSADRSWDVFVDLVNPLVAGVSAGPDPATGKVDQIVVTFSEAMAIEPLLAGGSIVQAVTLEHAVAGPYTLAPEQFQYDAVMRQLTLTVAALTPGVHELRLDGSRLFDLAGNPSRGGSGGVVVLDIPALALEQSVQAGGADLQAAGYSVPSLADWDGDGRLDLLVGEKTADGLGQVRVYLNSGTAAAPVFGGYVYAQSGGADLTVPAGGCLGVFPRLFDWDGDGLNDLLLGLADGTVQWRRNVGVAGSPTFDSGTFVQAGPAGSKATIDVGERATLAIADWNADGRLDLVVGALDGRVRVYLNAAGTGAADLLGEQLVLDGTSELLVPSGRSSVAVADWNGDGLPDLILGNTDGQLWFYANMGSSAEPRFDGGQLLSADNVVIDLGGVPRSRPFVADYNADGRPDVLVGAADGLVRLYLAQATPATRPLPNENTGAPGGEYVYTFVPLQGPTDLALQAAVVPEAQPAGLPVGTFTATDPDAGETFSYTLVPGAGDGDNGLFQIVGDRLLTAAALDYEGQNEYSIRVRVTDHTGLWYEEAFTIASSDVQGVVSRHLFYNHSFFDGDNAEANSDDDAALATDKSALRPGGLGGFVNYTSYSRGLNGVMIDIENLANPAGVDAGHFAFRVGDTGTPAGWPAAPAPSGVTVRAGAGVAGSHRVTLIWPDGAIQNQWLKVTVLADAVTGLTAPDVFYFGNSIGESGDVAGDTLVDGYDVSGAAGHPRGEGNPATVADPYDFNRDALVDAADQGLAAAHSTDPDTCLRILDLREAPPAQISVAVSPASVAEDGSGQLTYTFTRSGSVSEAATITFRVTGTATFPGDYAVGGVTSIDAQAGTVTFAAGSATAVVTIDPAADDAAEADETAWLLVLPGADSAVGSPAHAAGTITNEDTATLIVTEFTATTTGFTARFGRDLDPRVLNLYDSASQTWGAADVSVTGAAAGPVRGSLVVSADRRQITFIQTGGLLEPDTYTVTLFSGAARFCGTTAGTLDGNADGTPGDDYQRTFTVAAPPAGTVTVSLPDMARGAGQPVNVPNTASGLPIRLSAAAGVTSLAVDLVYDGTLLEITAATLAAGLPADWSVNLDTATAGVAKITASGATPLTGTNIDVVRLTAAVPSTASYGAMQAIRLENASLNGGSIAAVGDVAVHKAAYLGDADGSGIHSSADAFLVMQAALGSASGFAAHPWTDPLIMADADGSGVLSAADAFLIVQEGLGQSEPFVPDNPHVGVTPVGGGVDPQFQIGVNLPANAGGLVSVPVNLAIEAAATNVGGIDFELFFDPAQLTIDVPGGISAGADTAGAWGISSTLVSAGHLRVGMIASRGQPLAAGQREIAQLEFRVAASLRDAQPVSERPGHMVALDIEPLDPRAGGYTWTATDGSLQIGPARNAGDVTERAGGDLLDVVPAFEEALSEIAADVALAWR